MEIITFEGQLNEKLFTRLQWLTSPRILRHLWWILLAVYGLGLLMGEHQAITANPLKLAIQALPYLFFVFFMAIAPRYAIRKHWSTNALIKSRVTGAADAEGIEWKTEYVTSRFPWKIFLKRKQAEDMVILYMATKTALYFPRLFFQDEAAWQSFCSIVEQNVTKG